MGNLKQLVNTMVQEKVITPDFGLELMKAHEKDVESVMNSSNENS